LNIKGKKVQSFADLDKGPIHVNSNEEIEALKSAAQLAAATLKHAMDNTQVSLIV
jgi:hypothetical protein